MAADLPDTTGDHPGLGRLRIAVLGAGRVGRELVRNLDALGIQDIDVYERDREAAASLQERCAVHCGDFWDELALSRLQQYDFAVCTINDRSARVRLNQKCLVTSVNLLQAWTEASAAIVEAYPFGMTGDCACFECDAAPGAAPTPLAALKLAAGATDAGVAVESIAGGLAAALLARVAAGSHGLVARRATLETSSGAGTSVELRRDPACARCSALERPMQIVHTRNRWAPSGSVAAAFPEALEQEVSLSDDIEGLGGPCRIGQLVERFGGGPIPAKFALTEVGGRTVCLDFEELRPASATNAAAPLDERKETAD